MSRHDLDPTSLLAGLVFAGLGALGLLAAGGRGDAAEWVLPLILVAVGVGGIAIALGRRPR